MKQNGNGWCVASLLLACALIVVGCGGSNNSQKEPVSGPSMTDEPTPTEPVTISTVTDWSAAMGTLTLDVSVSRVPTQVRLYPKGKNDDWVETDVSAPFSFTINISDFAPGDYEMLVIVDSGDASFEQVEHVFVTGCNGSQALCRRSYDQVRYVTTHNAMSNTADEWVGSNQNLDVPAQLRAGVHGLMLDTYRAVDPLYPWLMNVWSHAFETHYSAQVPEDFSCAHNRGTQSNDLFIFNHFLTGVFGAPELAEQVNYNPLLLNRVTECEVFHAALANFVTVDFVDIGDTVSTVRALNDMGGF
jgi:hypothetical protein